MRSCTHKTCFREWKKIVHLSILFLLALGTSNRHERQNQDQSNNQNLKMNIRTLHTIKGGSRRAEKSADDDEGCQPGAGQEQTMSRPEAVCEQARSKPGAMQEQGRSKSRAGALAVQCPHTKFHPNFTKT